MLLCISVGAAVGFMFIWHLYLVVSQQTTIEFYQNQVAKMAAKKKNMVNTETKHFFQQQILILLCYIVEMGECL